MEGGVLAVAEFYLHRARTEEAVECGLLGPMGGVKQGIPAGIDLVPKVHGVLESSVIVGDREIMMVGPGDLRGIDKPSAGLLVKIVSGAIRELRKGGVGTIGIVRFLGPRGMTFVIGLIGVGGRSRRRSRDLLRKGDEGAGGFLVSSGVREDWALRGSSGGGGDEGGLVIFLRLL